MKKTILYIGSVIILIFSAITFIFIPGLSRGLGSNELPPFGKYDGKKIEYAPGTDFANAVAQYTERFRSQGQQLNDSTYYYIYNYAFNATVATRAAISSVEKAGFVPGEKTINRTLAMYYCDENGKFSKKIYNSVPEADRKELRENVVKSLTQATFQEDNFGYELAGSKFMGLKASSKENDFVKTMGEKTRSFDVVTFDTSDYPESKVIEFAKAHADLFNKYDVSVITMADEGKLKGVAKQIANNELVFSDALNTYSEKYYSDSEGKYPNAYEHRLSDILENAGDLEKIKALSVNGVSDVLKTKNGYSIFMANAEKAAPDFSDKDVIDNARLYINANEAGTVDEYYMNLAKEFQASATANGINTACTQFNVVKNSIKNIPVNFGDNELFTKLPADSIPSLADASVSESFFEKAFSLKKGEISEPVKVGVYIAVVQMTGEETVAADESKINAMKTSFEGFDTNAADREIFSSKKIENNVSDVYINYILKNK